MACYLPMVCKKAYGDNFSVMLKPKDSCLDPNIHNRVRKKKTVELPDDGSGFVRSFSKMAG